MLICRDLQAMDTAEAEQPEGDNSHDTMDDVDAELEALAEVKSHSLSRVPKLQ